MSLRHNPLIQPKHMPFRPFKRINIRSLKQFPENPTTKNPFFSAQLIITIIIIIQFQQQKRNLHMKLTGDSWSKTHQTNKQWKPLFQQWTYWKDRRRIWPETPRAPPSRKPQPLPPLKLSELGKRACWCWVWKWGLWIWRGERWRIERRVDSGLGLTGTVVRIGFAECWRATRKSECEPWWPTGLLFL